MRAAQGDLLADQSGQVTEETVGPISVTYADGARQSVKYAFVDAMLRGAGLMTGSDGMIPVVRC